eukprot:1638156-Lingulodinium_polyedra.AAC.1
MAEHAARGVPSARKGVGAHGGMAVAAAASGRASSGGTPTRNPGVRSRSDLLCSGNATAAPHGGQHRPRLCRGGLL